MNAGAGSIGIFLGLAWIVLAFGAIHAIEYASYMARLAGVALGKQVSGYVLQNAIYVFTRFLYLSLMPVLGLCIDVGVDAKSYLITVHLALVLATIASIGSLRIRYSMAHRFEAVLRHIDDVPLHIAAWRVFRSRSSVVSSSFDREKYDTNAWRFSQVRDHRLLVMSTLVFTAYATGVFGSFFFALIFSEYRAAISQLSGLINGAATVLLTFVIEPKISARIDSRSGDVESTLATVLWGRLLGTAIFAHIVVGLLWVVAWGANS